MDSRGPATQSFCPDAESNRCVRSHNLISMESNTHLGKLVNRPFFSSISSSHPCSPNHGLSRSLLRPPRNPATQLEVGSPCAASPFRLRIFHLQLSESRKAPTGYHFDLLERHTMGQEGHLHRLMMRKVSLKKSGVGTVLAGSYPWVHSLSRRPPFSWQVMLFAPYLFVLCVFLSTSVGNSVISREMGAEISLEERARHNHQCTRSLPFLCSEKMEEFEKSPKSSSDLNVSFGYQCSAYQSSLCSSEVNYKFELSSGINIQESNINKMQNSSFSCLSGAALSANYTLANTNICNGVIGEGILPELDSPQSFKRVLSSASLSRLDLHSPSSPSDSGTLEVVRSSSFLNAMDVQMAGGAAGEDRVQAVCSEENGWLFCGVYDGFNGRDAADFLAGTLYENIGYNLFLLECKINQQNNEKNVQHPSGGRTTKSELSLAIESLNNKLKPNLSLNSTEECSTESFRLGVLNCLTSALVQAENDFMYRVEQEMDDRPDLVSVGSCVLTVLLHGMVLYVMNLGDSRAVLATSSLIKDGPPRAIQLTETHTLDNEEEYRRILADHPDDPSPVTGGRVKGKLKLTRAFGVGYLKKRNLNDALMGILRVRDLREPTICLYPSIHHKPQGFGERLVCCFGK
ncbi:unnamed protein product [Musa textilis]